jgi:hypothetical protein
MARGWESKSVEEQQAEAQATSARNAAASAAERERSRQSQTLNLQISRVRQQIAAAQNPAHREMLERALADLERKLAEVG